MSTGTSTCSAQLHCTCIAGDFTCIELQARLGFRGFSPLSFNWFSHWVPSGEGMIFTIELTGC